jgi:signal peptidase I
MLKTVKRVIGIVVLVSFLITFLYFAYIRVTNSSPSLFGVSILRVNSDDMEPSIKAGEIIVIKKVNPAELKKGDVITYRCEVGGNKGNDITHQISKEPYEFNGEYYFTTRSLSMGAVDDPEIKDKGRYYYKKLPLLRHSREVYAKYVMEGEEYREQVRKNLIYLIDLGECSVRQLILPDMPPEETLFYYEKAAALYVPPLGRVCLCFTFCSCRK